MLRDSKHPTVVPEVGMGDQPPYAFSVESYGDGSHVSGERSDEQASSHASTQEEMCPMYESHEEDDEDACSKPPFHSELFKININQEDYGIVHAETAGHCQGRGNPSASEPKTILDRTSDSPMTRVCGSHAGVLIRRRGMCPREQLNAGPRSKQSFHGLPIQVFHVGADSPCGVDEDSSNYDPASGEASNVSSASSTLRRGGLEGWGSRRCSSPAAKVSSSVMSWRRNSLFKASGKSKSRRASIRSLMSRVDLFDGDIPSDKDLPDWAPSGSCSSSASSSCTPKQGPGMSLATSLLSLSRSCCALHHFVHEGSGALGRGDVPDTRCVSNAGSPMWSQAKGSPLGLGVHMSPLGLGMVMEGRLSPLGLGMPRMVLGEHKSPPLRGSVCEAHTGAKLHSPLMGSARGTIPPSSALPLLSSQGSPEITLLRKREYGIWSPIREKAAAGRNLQVNRWKSMAEMCPLSVSLMNSGGESHEAMFQFPRQIPKVPLSIRQWPERNEAAFARGKPLLRELKLDPMSFSRDDLAHLALEIFVELDVPTRLRLPMERLQRFILAVMGRMKENPYHNWYHAFDVTQTVYALSYRSGLLERLTDMEKFALVVGALCHDLEHPGFNNMKLTLDGDLGDSKLRDDCLEKHHSLRAFELMVDNHIDLLRELNTTKYYEFRTMVVNVILATDVSQHAAYVSRIKAKNAASAECLLGDVVASPLPSKGREGDDTILGMQVLMKVADVSNVIKPFPVAAKWAVRVTDEFFEQGDREREMGLDVTSTCDRSKQTRVGLQKGFIDSFAGPFFDVVSSLYPRLEADFAPMHENRKVWDSYTDERLLEEWGGYRDDAVASSS